MITVSVKQLISAIDEADICKLPDMTVGTDYLYNNLYRRLTKGEDVRLSEIDFDAFELDDVDSVRELYTNVLEPNEYKADSIVRSLRGLSPAAAASAFV